MKRFVVCLLLAIIWQNNFAQYSTLKFDYLTIQQGLSSNNNNVIFQDSKGFMWFGSYEGLNKYDGYSMRVYRKEPQNDNSISYDYINSVAEDKNGYLWIATSNGLNRFDRYSDIFTRFYSGTADGALPSNNIQIVMVDSENRLWVGTDKGLCFVKLPDSKNYNTNVLQFTGYSGLDNELKNISVTSIIQDKQENVWFTSTAPGIYKYSKSSKTFARVNIQIDGKPDFDNNVLKKIFEDSDGDFWITTYNKGFIHWNRKSIVFKAYSYNVGNNVSGVNIIRSICQDNKGTIWLGTDGAGLVFWNKKTETYDYLLYNPLELNSLRGNAIYSLFKDNTGIIWVSVMYEGIHIQNINKQKFGWHTHIPNKENGLSFKSVNTFLQESDDLIWIGTDGGGLELFNRKTGLFKHYKTNPQNKHSISSNYITGLCRDKSGTLWISTYMGGICKFDKKSESFQHFPVLHNIAQSGYSNDAWCIFNDSKDNLWLGTSNGLVIFNKQDNSTFLYQADNFNPYSLTNNFVNMITEDNDRNLWISTSEGFCRFNLDSVDFKVFPPKIKFIQYKSGSYNRITRAILMDSSHELWVGFTTGLIRVGADNKITQFTVNEGLLSNSIRSLIEDNQHNIWIATNKGLSVFDRKTQTFRNYVESDGLQGLDFHPFQPLKTNDGQLYFGGSNGFNAFYPEQIYFNKNKPKIYFTELKILNKSIKPNDVFDDFVPLTQAPEETRNVEISYKYNVISFSFALLNFTNPEKNTYAYQLEGLNENWIPLGNERNILFTSLQPGEYNLNIKAWNNDGISNDQFTKLKLIITPPFWQTLLFKVIIGTLLCAAILSLYFYRVWTIQAEKRKLQLEVDKRTSEITDAYKALNEKKDEILMQNNEILKRNDDIKQMAQQLHDADQSKLQFFIDIAHEFRTPLTLIASPLECILSSKHVSPEFLDMLMLMQRNTHRLLRLVNQLLDLSKIDSGNMKLQAQYDDIVNFIQKIKELFDNKANQQNIEFLFNSGQPQIYTWFDKDFIEKITYNLLSNAFKFIHTGGFITIDLNLKKDENALEFIELIVSDTGTGIAEDKLQSIFQPFYQADRMIQGTGLGLTLVKEFTELHRGKITVSSVVNKGTHFKVTIPYGKDWLKPDEFLPEVANLSSKVEAFMSFDTNDPINSVENEDIQSELTSILVIDDTSDIRIFLKKELSSLYSVIEAENGNQGFDKAKQFSPDLIVCDVMMPEMNGYELCAKLKKDEYTSHIPIIMLTALGNDQNITQGLETGADDYVVKPFNIKHLKLKIKNIIARRHQMRSIFGKQISIEPKDFTTTTADERFLLKAIELVEKNITNPDFDNDMFVKEMYMSRTLLYTKLKKLTNQTVSDFIRNMRLKKAVQLMQKNYGSVTEIAYEVGFNNLSWFAKCFKELYGQSPSEYMSNMVKTVNNP